jgi:hypothetical protein
MGSALLARLHKPESAIAPKTRWVCVSFPHDDLFAKAAAIEKAEHDLLPGDFIILCADFGGPEVPEP